MNIFRSKEHKILINLVTSILMTAILCQNIVWAKIEYKNECLSSRSLFKLFEKKGKTLKEALDIEDRLFALREMILKRKLEDEDLKKRDGEVANVEFIEELKFSYKVQKVRGYADVYFMGSNHLYGDQYGNEQVVLFYPKDKIPWKLLKGNYGVVTNEDKDCAKRGFWIYSDKRNSQFTLQENIFFVASRYLSYFKEWESKSDISREIQKCIDLIFSGKSLDEQKKIARGLIVQGAARMRAHPYQDDVEIYFRSSNLFHFSTVLTGLLSSLVLSYGADEINWYRYSAEDTKIAELYEASKETDFKTRLNHIANLVIKSFKLFYPKFDEIRHDYTDLYTAFILLFQEQQNRGEKAAELKRLIDEYMAKFTTDKYSQGKYYDSMKSLPEWKDPTTLEEIKKCVSVYQNFEKVQKAAGIILTIMPTRPEEALEYIKSVFKFARIMSQVSDLTDEGQKYTELEEEANKLREKAVKYLNMLFVNNREVFNQNENYYHFARFEYYLWSINTPDLLDPYPDLRFTLNDSNALRILELLSRHDNIFDGLTSILENLIGYGLPKRYVLNYLGNHFEWYGTIGQGNEQKIYDLLISGRADLKTKYRFESILFWGQNEIIFKVYDKDKNCYVLLKVYLEQFEPRRISGNLFTINIANIEITDLQEKEDVFNNLFPNEHQSVKWRMQKGRTIPCQIVGSSTPPDSPGYLNRLLYVYPTDDALDEDIELLKLDGWKYGGVSGRYSREDAFGRIIVGLVQINNSPALIVRVQPNPNIYKIKPRDRQKQYSKWYNEAFEYLAVKAKEYGINDIYAVPIDILLQTEEKYNKWSDMARNRSLVVPFKDWERSDVKVNKVNGVFYENLKDGNEYSLLHYVSKTENSNAMPPGKGQIRISDLSTDLTGIVKIPKGSPSNFFRILTRSENVNNKVSPEVSPEFERIIAGLKNKQVKAGQVFELTQKPNKAELQSITTIGETEVALLHLPNGNRWFIVKGNQDHAISDDKLEKASDLFAHYHPPQTYCADLPHFHDAFIATMSGKDEFILHADGITYFKGIKTDPISGEAWTPRKRGEVESKFFAFIETQERTKSFKEYTEMVRRFFEKMGVDLKTKKWEELKDEEVFEQFLQRKVLIEKLNSETGISIDTIERDMRILRKTRLAIRENTDGRITFRINPDIAQSPELIKIAQDILDEEYQEGKISYKTKNKKERERIVSRLIASVYEIPGDVQNLKTLTDNIIPAKLKENIIYEIRYDASRLSESHQEIINTYIKLLKERASNPDNIVVIPFRDVKRDYIIKVICKDTNRQTLGDGQVNIDIENGLGSYPLRIIGMLNIALAAANVPDNLTSEQIEEYRPLITFIQRQYMTITGNDLVIPNSIDEMLKVIRAINLPKPEKMNLDEVNKLNRLAKQLLVSA